MRFSEVKAVSAVKSVIKALLILALILSLTLLSACSGLSITADDFLSPVQALNLDEAKPKKSKK